jgi:hypothetical protein
MRLIVRQYYHFEWTALDEDSYDGWGSPMGLGNSREEAIQDLMNQLDDAEKLTTLDSHENL